MVKDVAVQLAPPVIANSQIVDYRSRSIESAIALVSAVNNLPQSPPLPNPLPGPPKPPISYMSSFSEQIDADSLTYRDQIHLVAELKEFLNRTSDQAVAAQLLRRLRDRPDITEKVGRDIDELLVTLAPDDSVAASAKLFEALRTQEAWPDPEAPAAPPGHVQRKRRRLVIIVAAAIVLFITGFGLRMWTLANGGDLATS